MAILPLLFLLTACNSQKIEVLTGPTMGSSYRIQYVSDKTAPSKSEIENAVADILANIDKSVSTYRRDSDVSKFNDAPAGTCQAMPPDVATLFHYAQLLNTHSQGAYDITLLPALSVWGFGPNGRVAPPPTHDELSSLRDIIGMQHIRARNSMDIKTPILLCKERNSLIEFNSIAAGYAVDRISDYLQSRGLENFLVEITGELRANGHKPDGSRWRIALEAPISNSRVAQRIINLEDLSASTSGDYRDYYEEDGVRYSHTLDPRTLSPVTHNLASVSVIAKSAMEADGLSTLLMVMGPEQGYAYALQEHLKAMFVINTGTGKEKKDERTFIVRTTPEFENSFPSLKGKS